MSDRYGPPEDYALLEEGAFGIRWRVVRFAALWLFVGLALGGVLFGR